MTNQEAYNTVRKHLLKQDKKCLKDTGMCMYRNDSGLKCALGALIPNYMYNAEMEGGAIQKLFKKFPVLRKHLEDVDIGMLMCLQSVHDNDPIHRWDDSLNDIAEAYHLTS